MIRHLVDGNIDGVLRTMNLLPVVLRIFVVRLNVFAELFRLEQVAAHMCAKSVKVRVLRSFRGLAGDWIRGGTALKSLRLTMARISEPLRSIYVFGPRAHVSAVRMRKERRLIVCRRWEATLTHRGVDLTTGGIDVSDRDGAIQWCLMAGAGPESGAARCNQAGYILISGRS